jgi:hypothetical protein
VHLPDTDGIIYGRDIPNFWDTINRIGVTLNLTMDEIAEMMEVTPYRLQTMQKFNKEPNVSSAMAFSKRINVSFEALVLDRFNYKLMAQQYFGNNSSLPERYSEFALSKRLTVIPHLDYIENYFGWAARALVLRRFQMTEAMFVDPQAPINMRFSLDLIDYLLNYYRNPQILEHMGWNSARNTRTSALAGELRGADTPEEIYERMTDGAIARFVERNFFWKLLSVSDGECMIEGSPSDESTQMPDYKTLFTRGACMIRSGFISYLPNYANFRSARVKKVSCVAEGSQSCRFQVTWPEAAEA